MARLKRRTLLGAGLYALVHAGCDTALAATARPAAGISGFADVQALRASRQLPPGAVVALQEYTLGSGRGGGVFTVDTTDTGSPDDGGWCFVNHSGQRLKRICEDNSIAASCYGIDGQPGDHTRALKNFMQAPLDKIIDVDIHTAGMARVADNTRVSAVDGHTIHAIADVDSDVQRSRNNQGQTLEVGDRCHLEGVRINGGGFRNNGFLVDGRQGVVIRNCLVENGRGQALLDVSSLGSLYDGNTLRSSRHGIQLWLSRGTVVSNNLISQVTGGIWAACAVNVSVTHNHVHDCADVGIDWEGGHDCRSDSNRVEYCANGELAIFATGAALRDHGIPMGNLFHRNNTVVRGAGYRDAGGQRQVNALDDAGACMVYGNLDAHLLGPLVFDGNIVEVEAASGRSLRCFSSRASADSDASVVFSNNRFTSHTADMGQLHGLNGVRLAGNEFVYAGAGDTPAATRFADIAHLSLQSNIATFGSGRQQEAAWTVSRRAQGGSSVQAADNRFIQIRD